MAPKLKIALAEDQAVNRSTFMRKAEQMHNCELIFIANNGHDCLEKLNGLPESQKPDVLFMDIEMPGMNGIETIARAHLLYPNIHFLVLTVFDDDDKVFEAIKAGAEGYLLKHESAQILEDAVNSVVEFGGVPMSPAIARKALMLLQKAQFDLTSSQSKQSAIPENISERESEVLHYLVAGMDAKSISVHMNLSVHTVRKHIANVYEKLHVCSKAQIISLAHKQGWFQA
jgi:DNA-binding NarL/FixJ family response regulator